MSDRKELIERVKDLRAAGVEGAEKIKLNAVTDNIRKALDALELPSAPSKKTPAKKSTSKKTPAKKSTSKKTPVDIIPTKKDLVARVEELRLRDKNLVKGIQTNMKAETIFKKLKERNLLEGVEEKEDEEEDERISFSRLDSSISGLENEDDVERGEKKVNQDDEEDNEEDEEEDNEEEDNEKDNEEEKKEIEKLSKKISLKDAQALLSFYGELTSDKSLTNATGNKSELFQILYSRGIAEHYIKYTVKQLKDACQKVEAALQIDCKGSKVDIYENLIRNHVIPTPDGIQLAEPKKNKSIREAEKKPAVQPGLKGPLGLRLLALPMNIVNERFKNASTSMKRPVLSNVFGGQAVPSNQNGGVLRAPAEREELSMELSDAHRGPLVADSILQALMSGGKALPDALEERDRLILGVKY